MQHPFKLGRKRTCFLHNLSPAGGLWNVKGDCKGALPVGHEGAPPVGHEGAPPVGHEGAPPVAESSDRNGWAAACLGASEAQREGLAATRGSQATEAVGQALALPKAKRGGKA